MSAPKIKESLKKDRDKKQKNKNKLTWKEGRRTGWWDTGM